MDFICQMDFCGQGIFVWNFVVVLTASPVGHRQQVFVVVHQFM
jgi:hypothetical protein